jgi:hypothetical protein
MTGDVILILFLPKRDGINGKLIEYRALSIYLFSVKNQ